MNALMPIRSLLSSIVVVVMLGGAVPALAQGALPSTVLVSNSLASVTRAEYDAELLKLPIDLRAGFANNPRRVTDLLTRMLVQKSLAAQARTAKLDNAPDVIARAKLELDRLLAQAMVERIESEAGAEFDASRAQYNGRAREIFLVDRAKYETPEQVTATHILFDVKKHGADTARKMADDARAKIVAGADMGKLAKDLSDDPSAQSNAGKLDWFAKREMDPAFADAAFALRDPGDLSAPVQSQFGWHVIRLDGRRPPATPAYEQVRDTIFADLRKKYVDDKREAVIAAIRRDSQTQVNRDAVDALTPRVDIEAARRALGMTPGGAPAPAPGGATAPSTAPAPAPK
jgi:peptidyl-prolyl cis-trans isomerase C